MKTYDNCFDVFQHLVDGNNEAFRWKGINSTSLADVMELAEKKGFLHMLDCYDEELMIRGEAVEHHVRAMIFVKPHSLLENVREEIKEKSEDDVLSTGEQVGLSYALDIIDKHLEGISEGEETDEKRDH